MQCKTIVIVEDNETQRLALQSGLERRHFRVGSAATVAEARKVVESLGDDIDVMVLDMRLEDSSEPETTGPDIGIELQRGHPSCSPEYLIHSGFAEVNYYKMALRLGAAAYLSKSETTRLDVIRHVRALALKRALRLDRPQVEQSLRTISESTKNLADAVRKFCREVLASELDACLGIPYLLLLTDEGGTQNCSTNTDLPNGYSSLYASLQAMAQGISSLSSSFEVTDQEIKQLPIPISPDEIKIYQRLPRSAFIPLANVQHFRLSLGLFEPFAGEASYPEETGKLASVLAQYVRSTIVEHFVRILIHLDSQKRAMMLRSTSHLCLSLGEDQQEMIEEGIMAGQLEEGSETHGKLLNMATDLWETGTILANVATFNFLNDDEPAFEITELIGKAFTDLEERMDLQGLTFTVEGSCMVKARKEDIYIAVIRVLQWLAQRKAAVGRDINPEIRVRCQSSAGISTTIFEDRSTRLPKKLRKQLFLPFSVSAIPPLPAKLPGPGLYLPLYLAKILVEEKYGGSLEDRSDELADKIGHRVLMQLNASNSRAIENSTPHQHDQQTMECLDEGTAKRIPSVS